MFPSGLPTVGGPAPKGSNVDGIAEHLTTSSDTAAHVFAYGVEPQILTSPAADLAEIDYRVDWYTKAIENRALWQRDLTEQRLSAPATKLKLIGEHLEFCASSLSVYAAILEEYRDDRMTLLAEHPELAD